MDWSFPTNSPQFVIYTGEIPEHPSPAAPQWRWASSTTPGGQVLYKKFPTIVGNTSHQGEPNAVYWKDGELKHIFWPHHWVEIPPHMKDKTSSPFSDEEIMGDRPF